MELAVEILIVGGLFNLAFGTVTGAILGSERRSAKFASRYLVFAHVGPFTQGAMLLGLVFVVKFSSLSDGAESVAASLFVASSVMLAVRDTVNWMRGMQDEFAEKPMITRTLGVLSFLLLIPALVILIIGVVKAL